MKASIIKCPNCNAMLDVSDDKKILYCQYCGTKLLIDDEVYRTEHTENINIVKKSVDITKLRSAEYEHEIKKRELDLIERREKRNEDSFNNIVSALIPLLLIIIIPWVIIGIKNYSDNKKEKEMNALGMISAGYYEDYEEHNYELVIIQLEQKGFTNIKTLDLANSEQTNTIRYNVESISIEGSTSFRSTDYFEPNTPIIVAYH